MLSLGRISREAVKELLNRAQELFRKEKNVVDVKGPVNVIGDIHGQYYDMLHVLKRAGTPGVEKSYVFLGDYVDRGTFSCEVCLYLFSLKINHPARITMIRGNHETRAMAIYHNFEKEVKSKYGEEIFDLWQVVFDTLPLAAIVETPEMGRWFCCHGGLSPSFKTIDDINEMDRFQEPPDDGGLCDIIWSDPIANDQAPNQNFTRNRERSCSWVYGYNPIIDFLEDNQLSTIVRAHQVKEVRSLVFMIYK
jgi:serine/threonine-protein phosphatase 2B catalytic subunit